LVNIDVNGNDRSLNKEHLNKSVAELGRDGIKHVIVIANMMTTMFGSADDPDLYSNALKKEGLNYVIHVDGAYGGFIYPFCHKNHKLDFRNPEITSIALDAHKMVQAPYGTGIFIIKKGWMAHTYTKEASYVKGLDATLIGSRSGANAIAVWMILMNYGPYGWEEKIMKLIHRTRWLCEQLDRLGIPYYRSKGNNIVTIPAEYISEEIAEDFVLIPDDHHNPKWYKIVIMDHVTIDKMTPFIELLKN
jgi:glutamate/tyrosine decarboxylase-like PLP-dependent enzyme